MIFFPQRLGWEEVQGEHILKSLLHKVTLYSKYARVLTFEIFFCQVLGEKSGKELSKVL